MKGLWIIVAAFLLSLCASAQAKPEVLIIQHSVWSVNWVKETPTCPNDGRKGACTGLTQFSTKTISIVEDSSESENLDRLLHEILHAELYEKSNWTMVVQDFQYKQSAHDLIYRFSPLMGDALLNNPVLVRYILANSKIGGSFF